MKTELEQRLRRLDHIEPPDLWPDVASRTPGPPRNGPSGLRTAALVVACLGAVAASLVLLARAFDHRGGPGPRVPASPPVALPANGEIWALGGGGEGGSAIYSVDPITGGKTLLWHDGRSLLPKDKSNFALAPTNYDYAWSPDASHVAFSHVVLPPPGFPGVWPYPEEIYVMNADGSGLMQLTHDNAYDAFPSWSPDGTRILFTSYRGTSFENGCLELWNCPGDLYVIAADGSGEVQITSGPAADSMASWSPDGERILFRSTRDGSHGHVYVMNADGSGATQLTSGSEFDMNPVWSPDGSQIAYVACDEVPGHTCLVWVMNADGSDRHMLADTNVEDWSGPGLAWSPDGSEIAYSRWVGPDRMGVYLMNADGSDQRLFASVPELGGGLRPIAWRPLPGSPTG